MTQRIPCGSAAIGWAAFLLLPYKQLCAWPLAPLSPQSSYDNENRARSSRVMELPDNSSRVASEKQHGTESENTWNFPIFDTFGRWKAIAPRSNRNTKNYLNSKCEGSVYRQKSPPTSGYYLSSDYTCRPNIPRGRQRKKSRTPRGEISWNQVEIMRNQSRFPWNRAQKSAQPSSPTHFYNIWCHFWGKSRGNQTSIH